MCQGQICYIVPPYLLQGIADSQSEEVTDEIRECAHLSLSDEGLDVRARRAEIMAALAQPRGYHAHGAAGSSGAPAMPHRHSIVPDHLLQHIAESEDVDEETRACARRDLEHIRAKISDYQAAQATVEAGGDGEGEGTAAAARSLAGAAAETAEDDTAQKPPKPQFYRAVSDAKRTKNERKLPGPVVRLEGQKPCGDVAADAAYDNCGLVLQFYKDKFNWNSIDNKGMQVISSVHFGVKYENAYWDPVKMQMVYGDGADFLYKFAECIDVIGHEMTHAVTEHTSPLDYNGQSGALNEHISDVFGVMVKQFKEDETADKADWLIGEGCLLPGVKGVALRNMKDPGTAYNDPRFGKDPQPDHFKGFKAIKEDNGGVHLFSGIPNRAFCLASIAFGGYSWEKAGQIWWATMNSGRVPPRCNFLQFADVTVEIAEEKFDEEAAKIVREAWNTVGVVRKSL